MHVEHLGQGLFLQTAIGRIQPEPPLLFHHFPFRVKSRLVNLEETHPFRFEPQYQFQLVCRHRLYVYGLVEGRVTVARAADAPNVIKMVRRPETVRPPEHHVLEHVGKALAFRVLVLGTHVIPDIHCDDGTGEVLQRNDFQAVVQDRFLIVQAARIGRCRRAHGCRRHQHSETQHWEQGTLHDWTPFLCP